MTPWTIARQAPLSMGFSKQEYWSGLPFPSSGGSSRLRDRTWVSHTAGRFFTARATREDQVTHSPIENKNFMKKENSLDALRKSYLTFNVEKRQMFKESFLKINLFYLFCFKKKKEKPHIKQDGTLIG